MKDINCLVKHYAGSISYGTNHKNSDVDFRGLFALEQKKLISPFVQIDEIDDETEEDTKYYELSKYFRLASQMNPNIIETLWVDKQDIVHQTKAYEFLRDNREFFLNKKIADTTVGMAQNKIASMKGRNKWVNKPQPKEPPEQKDFVSLLHNFGDEKRFKANLEDFKNNHTLFPYEGKTILGLIKKENASPYDKFGHLNVKYDPSLANENPVLLIKFNKDEYNKTKKEHKDYWNWIECRNDKRSELEEKFGYDTKDAMHLVRVLRMGEEALRDGEINVKRKDNKELLDILAGKWGYEEILEYATKTKDNLNNLLKTTDIPDEPEWDKLTDLLYETYQIAWKEDLKAKPELEQRKKRFKP